MSEVSPSNTCSILKYAMASDTRRSWEYPLRHLFLEPRWVIYRFILSIRGEFLGLTVILLWCSTKLPVVQYSLLCRCYKSRLITTTTKQTRKYSVNRSFVSNIYISKTRIQARLRGNRSSMVEYLPLLPETISIYINWFRCQQRLDRSPWHYTRTRPPTFIYHQLHGTYWRTDSATLSNPQTPKEQGSPYLQ